MKVSKYQLRRIIKEEKLKVLAENRIRRAVRQALLERVLLEKKKKKKKKKKEEG